MYQSFRIITQCIVFSVLMFTVCADVCASFSQSTSSTWNSGGSTFTQVTVSIAASSSTITSLTLSATFPSSVSGFDSIWNVEQSGASYKLPSYVWQNGGIKKGSPYTFGYIIKSAQYATFSLTASCGSASTPAPSTPAPSTPAPTRTPAPATPSPATPAPTRTPAPATPSPATPAPTRTPAPATPSPATPAPTRTPAPATPAPSGATATPAPIGTSPVPSLTKTCDVVFVIDNYIVRSGKSIETLRAQYTSYFADVQKFYAKNFGIQLTMAQMYFEQTGSFTDTMSDGELLDSFRSAIIGRFFNGLQTGACMYHLITGRQPYGVGGLSFIGAACDNTNQFNNGFTVDGQASEDSTMVVRRMTHEMGHIFGGEHFDYYSSNPAYKCDSGASNPDQRVMRDTSAGYQYLQDGMFFTQCVTRTIQSALPAFQCMWSKNPQASVAAFPSVTFYDGKSLTGPSVQVPAFNGVSNACYNIVYPHYGLVNSYTLSNPSSSPFATVKGIKFFASPDCLGESWSVNGQTSNNIGDGYSAKTYSYQYIL